VLPKNRRRVLLPEQRNLLETFAGQIGLALERARLAELAESTRVSAERENLRNTLLASISHDLRTPLAAMAGAASTLGTHADELDEPSRTSLAKSIETKAREMSELVSKVLDLMRFDSGQIELRREWETMDDLVAAALEQNEERLARHRVETSIPADLPPVFVDAVLVVQVLGNLLDNAAKYTPQGTRVTVAAAQEEGFVRVTVDDDGPGLPNGDPERLFEKFQRGIKEGAIVGVGLGLAICRAIVNAHGGAINARNRPGGGARLTFTLPTTERNA
jgi:two-component system sensor histidine kinase KdpD